MNFLELVKSRYSCRQYANRPVEKEKLEYVMECVRLAPSAVNRQPWRFRVVEDVEVLQKLWQCYNREWFKSATVCIVASVVHDEEWVRSDGKRHGDIDVAIAVEHLCLAAAEQGLGTCWVCNFDAALCKGVFAMPDNEEAVAIIPVGYPDCEPTEKKRKEMNEIVL